MDDLTLETIPCRNGLPLSISYINGVRYVRMPNKLIPLADAVEAIRTGTYARPPAPSDRVAQLQHLTTVGGLTYAEAGARFGISRQRVHQLLQHACSRTQLGSLVVTTEALDKL